MRESLDPTLPENRKLVADTARFLAQFDLEMSKDDKVIKPFLVRLSIPPLQTWVKEHHAAVCYGSDNEHCYAIAGYNWPEDPKDHGYGLIRLNRKKVMAFMDATSTDKMASVMLMCAFLLGITVSDDLLKSSHSWMVKPEAN